MAFDTRGSITTVQVERVDFSSDSYARLWARLSEVDSDCVLALVLRGRTCLEAKMPDYIPDLDTSERQPFLWDPFVHQQPVRPMHKGRVLLTHSCVMHVHSHANTCMQMWGLFCLMLTCCRVHACDSLWNWNISMYCTLAEGCRIL